MLGLDKIIRNVFWTHQNKLLQVPGRSGGTRTLEVLRSNPIWDITFFRDNDNKSLYLCTYYRPPSDKGESLEQLGISLNRVLCKKTNSNIWVSGDFNLGHIDWNTPAVIPNKPEASLHHKILWRVPKYKILHDKTPNYLKKFCIPSSEVHTRNLRSVSSNKLAVIRPNTNIMKKSFAHSSAILWNKLPCNIKLSASLSMFKSKCFTYLKDISN
jgi:hypothetical protein